MAAQRSSYGPTWYRADGQIQTITGMVETIDRSSLFLGGTAALANGFPARITGHRLPFVERSQHDLADL